MNIKRITNTIENNYTNYNGGYIMYFKMIPDFFTSENKYIFKQLSFLHKISCIGSLILQILFKPLLCVFSTKVQYSGSYTHDNDILVYEDIKIKKVFYFLKHIPFFITNRNKMNNKDWDIILK